MWVGPDLSGTIKTALPGMDREVKEHYLVVIQAKDMAGQMGGLSGTTTVSITLSDVNDSPPRFANRKSFSLFFFHFIATIRTISLVTLPVFQTPFA